MLGKGSIVQRYLALWQDIEDDKVVGVALTGCLILQLTSYIQFIPQVAALPSMSQCGSSTLVNDSLAQSLGGSGRSTQLRGSATSLED